ncbi:FadR/GntR family transcriptional regulator [uncultured Enterovirga sp.]|uniref:FadR/GntR family transcriptional regulator n=1 Tax=uncultured Enterovirga sp. TaxID=2026352 RepID=UPI0035CADF6F
MSAEALQRVEQWLAAHPLGPERRLPAERSLATLLQLSRAELRKALAAIEEQGRLIRHVGRGTFLRTSDAAPVRAAEPGPPASGDPGLAELTSPRDLLQARLAIEPELARLAAVHATGMDIRLLRDRDAQVRSARSWELYDRADAGYHRAVAGASGNSLLRAVYDVVAGVRATLDWGRLRDRGPPPSPDHPSFAEHAAITDAIAARDRHAAADALRHHLMVEAAAVLGQIG